MVVYGLVLIGMHLLGACQGEPIIDDALRASADQFATVSLAALPPIITVTKTKSNSNSAATSNNRWDMDRAFGGDGKDDDNGEDDLSVITIKKLSSGIVRPQRVTHDRRINWLSWCMMHWLRSTDSPASWPPYPSYATDGVEHKDDAITDDGKEAKVTTIPYGRTYHKATAQRYISPMVNGISRWRSRIRLLLMKEFFAMMTLQHTIHLSRYQQPFWTIQVVPTGMHVM